MTPQRRTRPVTPRIARRTGLPADAAARAEAGRGRPYDVERVRRDFPILGRRVHGKPLVYLDNAATTQKPQAVIDAMRRYYERGNANVHRGVHLLSEEATAAYEGARADVARFLGGKADEVVFTRGATEAINLVAASFLRPRLKKGDDVVVTAMEHHSNIVPWQMACDEAGASLKVVDVTDEGELRIDQVPRLLGPRTRMFAFTHVSNALGTVNPVRELAGMAAEKGVPVLVDGAQAVPHAPVDVAAIGCDFYVASGHKMYGPTGIGMLWARQQHLEAMPPYQGGGDMIRSVSFQKTTYNDVPHKFEAGTPNIEGTIGLGAAVGYLERLGMPAIAAHELSLLEHATEALEGVPGVRLVGTAPHKAAVLSFAVEGVHPHDVGSLLDRDGVAIRTGHHCAMPLMERFGLPATCRASFGLYNTKSEVEGLAKSLRKVVKVFR